MPLIISTSEWEQLERGVAAARAAARTRSPPTSTARSTLLRDGLLPPALVFGPSGLPARAARRSRRRAARFLHIVAFDLARGPDGDWWVVAQRTQAPSGLGYALENRLIISRLFPEAFRRLRVQRLAPFYRALLETLVSRPRTLPATAARRTSCCSRPGPYNETYFEHAYLARYLGFTLVEGSDLTVRDDTLFLKTVAGSGARARVLRRLDDEFCDPLELRADSTLGVPGLVQAMRAGNVLVANVPGSGVLESPALLGFLPAICAAAARRAARIAERADLVVRRRGGARVGARKRSTRPS